MDIGGGRVLDKESATLRALASELTSNGHKKILFDLADLSYADSSGLGIWLAPTQLCETKEENTLGFRGPLPEQRPATPQAACLGCSGATAGVHNF